MRALIVDDSAITRGILEKAFRQSGFEIVGMVSNGRKAVDFCKANDVDVVISDYDMSEMNGIEATKIITKEQGIPVVIYYEDPSIRSEALDAGAVLFVQKPSLASYNQQMLSDFTQKVATSLAKIPSSEKRISTADIKTEDGKTNSFKVLCIGASTGGPSAVQQVLSGLGNNFPLPVIYAQHIDVGADEKMVKWFNQVCPNIPMSLPKDGETAMPGHVYMAAADTHLVIDRVNKDGLPVLHVSDEPPERFLRPAVNKLFRSAAKFYKTECLAVLLTGMGRDGAEGCKEIVNNGGFTICEDKSTCTVFGMPAAAIELDAASKILQRGEIAGAVLSLAKAAK